MGAREPSIDPVEIASFLGLAPRLDSPGKRQSRQFGLSSMTRGGDRTWRAAMHSLGHEPLAMAACTLAEMAISEYAKAPDSGSEFESEAILAVKSLSDWKHDPNSAIARTAIERNAIGFAVHVNVGERLFDLAGFRGRSLGRIIGKCASVVLAPENPRYVRWFGEAAEELCHVFHLPEEQFCRAVANVFQPYLHSSDR